MPASQRLLDQLSIILNNDGSLSPEAPFSDTDLHRFFDSMATDRIRLNRSDWPGQRVHTMIWNFPDLKPGLKLVVADYLADRWDDYQENGTPHAVEPIGHEKNDTRPLPETHSTGKHMPQGLVNTVSAPEIVVSGFNRADASTVKKDWFEVLTDWVAGIVTLWRS